MCQRDASITLPYDELILHTGEGIPYVIPEVALLFKAKGLREKDEADFQRVLTAMDQSRRSRYPSGCLKFTPAIRGLKVSDPRG